MEKLVNSHQQIFKNSGNSDQEGGGAECSEPAACLSEHGNYTCGQVWFSNWFSSLTEVLFAWLQSHCILAELSDMEVTAQTHFLFKGSVHQFKIFNSDANPRVPGDAATGSPQASRTFVALTEESGHLGNSYKTYF